MVRFLTASLVVAIALTAQTSTVAVNSSSGPPPDSYLSLPFYDGSGNLQYVCKALQRNVLTTWKTSNSTLTSVVVATNVGTVTVPGGHGLVVPGARVTITQANGAISSTLNGTYTVKTIPSTTTFTITTSGVSDATFNHADMVITTTYPLSTQPVWAIQILTYDGSSNLVGSYWADGRTGPFLKCTDRALY